MSEKSLSATGLAEPKPLIILGDGSWCGREADTRSNIYLLAKMIGINMENSTDTDVHEIDGKAWYIHGVGLGSTFLEYVANNHSKIGHTSIAKNYAAMPSTE